MYAHIVHVMRMYFFLFRFPPRSAFPEVYTHIRSKKNPWTFSRVSAFFFSSLHAIIKFDTLFGSPRGGGCIQNISGSVIQ